MWAASPLVNSIQGACLFLNRMGCLYSSLSHSDIPVHSYSLPELIESFLNLNSVYFPTSAFGNTISQLQYTTSTAIYVTQKASHTPPKITSSKGILLGMDIQFSMLVNSRGGRQVSLFSFNDHDRIFNSVPCNHVIQDRNSPWRKQGWHSEAVL